MTQNVLVAALVFGAAVVSLEFAFPVAIFEIAAGALGRNFLHMHTGAWVDQFAVLGSLMLMFLAGSEINLPFLSRHWKPISLMGTASFAFPWIAVMIYGHYVGQWPVSRTILTGIASSTTSVAVVYPVLRDAGMLENDTGKLLLAVALVPDFLCMIALTAFFSSYSLHSLLIALVLLPSLLIARLSGARFLAHYGKTSPEVKLRFVFMVILAIALLSEKADIHAALAVFLLGVAVCEVMQDHVNTDLKLRAAAFSLFVPVFYFKAGLNVSLPALWHYWPMILGLLLIAFGAKYLGLWLTGRKYLGTMTHRGAVLMNTRLTFGTITALYGLNHGILNQAQFSVQISMVILASLIGLLLLGRGAMSAEEA